MTKIAVVGTHGAGKSTLCYQLASFFKSKGGNVDIIQERIRFSPFPFNEKMTKETALWGYHAQILRELESLAKGFNVVICDRSAMDYFFYAEYFKISDLHINILKQISTLWMDSYDLIIIV